VDGKILTFKSIVLYIGNNTRTASRGKPMTEPTGTSIRDIIQQNSYHYTEWIAFARHKLHHCKMRKLHRLYSPEDIVDELIVKLATGERHWDSAKYPIFHVYFYMLIKSQIDNLIGTELHCVDLDEELYQQFASELFEDSFQHLLSYHRTDELMEQCVNCLNHDVYVILIFLYLTDGMKNHEIALALQVSISFVENAKKRIQRALHPLFEQYYEKKIELRV
jgi:DNA-directed RNA polymerase specialized sigma24 family protein